MAKLIVDVLATCLTIREMKSALGNIPSGLRFAYDVTIQRILDQGPSRSRRAFELMKWVLHAKRPLHSAEIEHVVSIEHESEDIDRDDIAPATTLASLCAGLVVIDEYDDFRFMHQTVSEYLIKHHPEKFRDANGSLAKSCLTYMGYKTFAEGPCEDMNALKARRLQYPAYTYCALYWHQHLVERDTLCEELKKAALKIFESEPHWRSAFQDIRTTRNSLSGVSENDTVLHLGAYLDAHLLFGDLMRLDPTCLNRQSLKGDSPLMVAAWRGSLQFASSLLKAGADVDIWGDDGENALYLAVLADQPDLVDLLITNPRVNINSPRPETGTTPLIIAARKGLVEIVDRLLKAGADVIGQNGHTSSPIVQAVAYNQTEAAKTLLSSTGIDVNGVSRVRGGTALHYAVSWGNAELVELLISYGADLQIRDDVNGFRPIDYALYFNDQRILDLLKASDPENGVH
jgi:ankyrin repeat protein